MTYSKEEINKLFFEQERAISALTLRCSALEQVLIDSGVVTKQTLTKAIEGLGEEFVRLVNEAIKNSVSERE
jgi:hypothetical protein